MLTYREALVTIFSRTDYERRDQPPYPERVWRLSRMEELLSQLGDPHRAYHSVHVAGTKGKGSTTAMIESVLRAAGLRTGMYTSPHLHTFRERIRLDGQPISEEEVAAQVERMLPILDARPEVTVFEIITALAMRVFSEHKVDVGVFEVGMGGRLDATNVLTPLVSVITSISLDHIKVLGDTIEAIAGEKAGIIKPGVPAVTAPQRPEALEVLRAACAARGADLIHVGSDWGWRPTSSDLDGQRLSIHARGPGTKPRYQGLRIPLLGDHQAENACTAVAAVEVLRQRGLSIPDKAVRRGLATVSWPGRMEILGRAPLLVVDGAHNGYSLERLFEALRKYLPYRRLIAVFGMGVTHLSHALLGQVLESADRVYVTRSRHARATPPEELATMATALGGQATVTTRVQEALRQALASACCDDLVLVTGSLFVVAEAREAWAALRGLPPLPSDPEGVYEVPAPAPIKTG